MQSLEGSFWQQQSTRMGQLATRLAVPLCALLIVAALALQIYQFDGRNYRDDEIRTVHAGLTLSPAEVVQWMSVDIHPPFWRVLAAGWVGVFGPNESIARFQTTFYAALVLALLFRHAVDLFDRRTALVAVFLLSTHAVFIFYAHEFRPYAALLMWILGLHLCFVRWLRTRRFRYAVLYVLCGAAALYTHFFAAYAIAGQAVAFLILVSFDRRRLLSAIGLWVAILLAFSGWLPSFLHSFLVTKPGGIGYSVPLDDPGTLGLFYDTFQLRPYALGILFMAAGLFIPLTSVLRGQGQLSANEPFRFRMGWRKWYWLIVSATVLVLALITDEFVTNVVTQRNFIIILPVFVFLAALGLRALPWQVTFLALPLLVNPAVRNFIDFQSNQPYREVRDFIARTHDVGDPVVVSVDQGTGRYFAYAYFLMDTMPGQLENRDFFNLTSGTPPINLPDTNLSHIVDASADSLGFFDAFTEDVSQVFWISSSDEAPYVDAYREALLDAGFAVTRSDRYTAYGSEYVVESYTRTGE